MKIYSYMDCLRDLCDALKPIEQSNDFTDRHSQRFIKEWYACSLINLNGLIEDYRENLDFEQVPSSDLDILLLMLQRECKLQIHNIYDLSFTNVVSLLSDKLSVLQIPETEDSHQFKHYIKDIGLRMIDFSSQERISIKELTWETFPFDVLNWKQVRFYQA